VDWSVVLILTAKHTPIRKCREGVRLDPMTNTETEQTLTAQIPPEQAGRRLDQALAVVFPDFSRSQLQQWIREGRVQVDGAAPRPRDRVRGGEQVSVAVPVPEPVRWSAQDLPLDVVYEDAALLVINKPPGLVVHPGAGNPDKTLLNALLHHDPGLSQVARAGIVHRLDKDTSGLLVVARTEAARRHLAAQLKDRSLKRVYTAVVRGVLISGGTVDAPLGRHSRDRTRMAVTNRGREAVSHFRILARYRAHTLISVSLETGRTHQIRVHLAHQGHPIVGDPVYGGRLILPRGADERLVAILRGFKRQALHAQTLGLVHPTTGESMSFSRPVPADMQALIDALAEDARVHAGGEKP
jgi:23S rRNA pseudouridine1911/1915/1917 synthase